MSLKSGNEENAGIGIKPEWCDAFTSQNDLLEVIEGSLLVQGYFGFADETSSTEWKNTKNPKMITSLTRLVSLKYKKDGKIEQFLMTIMGDKDYHDKGIGKLSDNSYLTREKQFSGYIFYHDLRGNFVNGWKYLNGKIVRKCSQNGFKTLLIHLKKADCIAVTVTLYNQFCTDWYFNGRYSYTRCEDRISEDEFYYLYCSYDPTDGEGGGYDGEYNPPTPTLNKTQQIQNQNLLDPTQKILLENALVALIDEGCLTQTVYNSLVSSGVKINFNMNPNGSLGQYYSATKTMTFKDNSSFTVAVLKEELFHAAQDNYYSGGITQYTNTGRVNIEFEAKLYKDIMATACYNAFQLGNAPLEIQNNYELWVRTIQDDPSNISDTKYQYWLNLFNQYTPAYSSPLSPNLSSPNALKSLLLTCLN